MTPSPADKPECADWGLWLGAEIEGHTGLGARTLFIRRLPVAITAEWLVEKSKADRVWFCKEFKDWPRLEAIASKFPSANVCIEIEAPVYRSLPAAFRKDYVIYVKVPSVVGLKAGDHVCVGAAFSDESFMIGTGAKVNPGDYGADTRIL